MISRVTYELRKSRDKIPKLIFCLFPRWLKDGRCVWLQHIWRANLGPIPWESGHEWGYYLTYDEALVAHYEYGKAAIHD